MRIVKSVMTLALGLYLVTQLAVAQDLKYTPTDAPPIDGDHVKFEVEDFKMLTLRFDDEFPDIKGIRGGGRMTWLMIKIEYKWTVDVQDRRSRVQYVKQGDDSYWLDRLEFDWRVVLAQPTESGSVKEDRRGGFNIAEKGAVRMARQVVYTNIKEGDDHYALIFVEAGALARYIKRLSPSQVFCDVRIKANGRDVGRLTAHAEDFFYMAARDEQGREADRAERERAKRMPRSSSRGASFYVSEKVKTVNSMLRNRMQTPWEWSKEDALETIVLESVKQ